MVNEFKGINLCSICLNLQSCDIKHQIQDRGTRCDDFKLDLQAFNKTPKFTDSRTGISNLDQWENNGSLDKAIGLCLFCNKRETCLIPKPEGGIWHCQDFSQ